MEAPLTPPQDLGLADLDGPGFFIGPMVLDPSEGCWGLKSVTVYVKSLAGETLSKRLQDGSTSVVLATEE